MFETTAPLRAEFQELETALADPAVHADLARARKVGRRYAELLPIIKALDEHDRLTGDLEAAMELTAEDASLAIEAAELEVRLGQVTERLTRLLAPRDPNDSSDVLMEIKSGEGGEESALFAADLLKMYSRYAESRGWKIEILDAQETDLGGYKSVTVAIKAPVGGEPDAMPYGVLKFEGGVHRVQRVPVTESRVGSIPPPLVCWSCPRSPKPKLISMRGICGSTCTARPAPAAKASTPLTRPCASPICPVASLFPARTSVHSCRIGNRRCACFEHGSRQPLKRKLPPRPPRPAAVRSGPSTGPNAFAPTTSPRTASLITESASSPTTLIKF